MNCMLPRVNLSWNRPEVDMFTKIAVNDSRSEGWV